MASRPLVSVIVPVFNDGAFLRTSLESLSAQSMADFEVIVSDDASTDDSREIAAAFARDDRRFHLHANVRNLGMTGNWNEALKRATGRYVVKLDADDALTPQTLAQLAAAMEVKDPPVVAYCRTVSCDAELRAVENYSGERALLGAGIDPQQAHRLPGHAWYALSFNDLQLWHSNAQIHRRETLLQMNGWDDSWGCASDTDLILRVLERNEPVVHLPHVGVLYRQRAGSISDQYRRNRWLAWESMLLHLGSLDRYHAAGGKLPVALRKAWWRYWRNWSRMRRETDDALSSLPPATRERLERRAARLRKPPLRIRVEGQARQWVWDAVHRSASIPGPATPTPTRSNAP
jgi:glycosyltransferase involved in cell wall biosynthesis